MTSPRIFVCRGALVWHVRCCARAATAQLRAPHHRGVQMSLFEPLFGHIDRGNSGAKVREAEAFNDEHAFARYRYMLQTAPPETIEQAHADAFARLTPTQRRLALAELAKVTPSSQEDALYTGAEDP